MWDTKVALVEATASRFSHLLGTGEDRQKAVWDTRLAESDNFIAAPSMGSIVPGWVLLIPKRHIFSFRELAPAEMLEARELAEQISVTLGERFGPVTLFEHGAAYSGSALGCGVDHAHLHLVPLDVDLLSAATADRSLQWEVLSHWCKLQQHTPVGTEYLLVADSTGKAYVANAVPTTGQYFRKLIASLLGRHTQWDYRTHPLADNAQATVDVFATASSVLFARSGGADDSSDSVD